MKRYGDGLWPLIAKGGAILKTEFSLRGTLSRRAYWVRFGLFLLCNVIGIFLLFNLLTFPGLAFLYPALTASLAVSYWFIIAALVKRLRDIGASCWWALLVINPFVGWICLFIITLLNSESRPGKWKVRNFLAICITASVCILYIGVRVHNEPKRKAEAAKVEAERQAAVAKAEAEERAALAKAEAERRDRALWTARLNQYDNGEHVPNKIFKEIHYFGKGDSIDVISVTKCVNGGVIIRACLNWTGPCKKGKTILDIQSAGPNSPTRCSIVETDGMPREVAEAMVNVGSLIFAVLLASEPDNNPPSDGNVYILQQNIWQDNRSINVY